MTSNLFDITTSHGRMYGNKLVALVSGTHLNLEITQIVSDLNGAPLWLRTKNNMIIPWVSILTIEDCEE